MSQALFDHVKALNIYGGNYYQDNSAGSNEGLLRLLNLKSDSFSAMHDSSARDPPPKCAEGTRKKVIADILTWIKDPNPQQSVLWLNGPFGNGKSAIMQTISESLRKDPQTNYFAGSFFFGRGKPGRDKAQCLIPIIAYQIAINFPWMRRPIETALSLDPAILSKSIEAQLRYLITRPLQQTVDGLNPSNSFNARTFHTPTIIIDGLDECEGHESQCRILSAISTAIFEDHAKLRFLIASRPEYQISTTFHAQPLREQHLAITLVDDYETYEELKQHIQAAFDRIYERHEVMHSVKKPWPSNEEIEKLARRASGQFLYASTILRFVDSDYAHPVDQLALVLTREAAAFSKMDELYTLILESCPCQNLLPSVLCSLVLLEDFGTQADLEIISGLRTEEISVVLRGLPAIIAMNRPDKLMSNVYWQQFMQFFSPSVSVHQSFIEFLTDKKRAGKFFVDKDASYQEMITRLDALITECLTLSQSELSIPQVFPRTWECIFYILLSVNGQFLGWPSLQMFFDDLKQHRDCLPSKLSNNFFIVLTYACDALESSDLPGTEDFIAMINSILDQNIFNSFVRLPTPAIWKIVGVVSLKEGFYPMDIHIVSARTGVSVPKIRHILEENQHLFDVNAFVKCFQPEDIKLDIRLKSKVKSFLLDKSRSRDLYFTYQRSVMTEFRSELQRKLEASKSGDLIQLDKTFTPLLQYSQWYSAIDINIDLEEGSSMHGVIKLLHAYVSLHGTLARRLYKSEKEFRRYDGRRFFEWLCRHLEILNANPEHSSTTSKLRDIIDVTKNKLVRRPFITALRDARCDKLPPFDAKVNIPRGHLEYNPFLYACREVWSYYSAVSILWDSTGSGISSEDHIAIVRYWTFVLLSFITGRTGPAYKDEQSVFEIRWECHLLQVAANKRICNLILTIHYLFINRPDLLCGDVTEAMEVLPSSFLKASLAWWRRHYNSPDTKTENEAYQNRSTDDSTVVDSEVDSNDDWDSADDYEDDSDSDDREYGDMDYHGEGFELWCEEAIALKERNAMKSAAFSTFQNRLSRVFPLSHSNVVKSPNSNGSKSCSGMDSLGVD